ncbi:O-acetyl-ADP-ribose deacetylase [Sulfurimonas microaerophilic]|uniref:O-acetyl-ADP-ribose deacetylase n=1 Tax=Sulfurimonas microaerophilic TaxID=3058392 RepID=UPI0027147000|nr:O-acetyl-ADP-ribose deacetylase [Sulfurimonas sp. hsl 1-7]
MANNKIDIFIGDITTLDTDAIVNAANSSLLGGGGVDGAIHRAGGSEILKECKTLRDTEYPNGLATGEAVITTAGRLKAKYVIHTVGPIYGNDADPKQSLSACYRNSLLLADSYKCTSIAFPAISTGIYGYPKKEAAEIAYVTVAEVLEKCRYIRNVVFVFHRDEDSLYLKSLLK